MSRGVGRQFGTITIASQLFTLKCSRTERVVPLRRIMPPRKRARDTHWERLDWRREDATCATCHLLKDIKGYFSSLKTTCRACRGSLFACCGPMWPLRTPCGTPCRPCVAPSGIPCKPCVTPVAAHASPRWPLYTRQTTHEHPASDIWHPMESTTRYYRDFHGILKENHAFQ